MSIEISIKYKILIFLLIFSIYSQAQPTPPPPGEPGGIEMGTAEQIELGKLLFFDKELSGNRNISCATCHHPSTHTGDALSLPVGEGGQGLGNLRDTGISNDAIVQRVERNSQGLFNLGRGNVQHLFHDGRVAIDLNEESGFSSPAGSDLPLGLENIVSVQAMFPVTSATEMAGQDEENEISIAVAEGKLAGEDGVWELLAKRLRDIPGYFEFFAAAYPENVETQSDITFVMAANAIAAFEISAWQALNSPFDQQLRGEDAMSEAALRGMALFNDKGCAICHAGPLQTDNLFHAIAMPQIGPGLGDNTEGFSDGLEDFGRERVSGNSADRFKFRTPSLRNIELTAPYGHSGAYTTLESIVNHYNNPVLSLMTYDQSQAILPSRTDLDEIDFTVMNSPARTGSIAQAALREPLLRPANMSASEVSDIVEFLKALTDPNSLDLSENIPDSVPSGLPISD
ncbi:cytochrome-c peroxidase [Microbulbifer sp. TRSA001]|uniref:cytochrome-c peroxidase n=1 Tax=Microbulbifer sp. TRSA001 TaxID=3243381 RepID=UPI0040394F00